MTSAAELIARLTALGFTAVNPETLSVKEQIRLFSGAKLVVGEVGAALANLMFVPRECKVIEIMPDAKQSWWIKRWCALRGMDWYCIYAAIAPGQRHVSTVDGVKYDNLYFSYAVNVDDVTRAVTNALQSAAPME